MGAVMEINQHPEVLPVPGVPFVPDREVRQPEVLWIRARFEALLVREADPKRR